VGAGNGGLLDHAQEIEGEIRIHLVHWCLCSRPAEAGHYDGVYAGSSQRVGLSLR
jgi:hypothetical protein